MSNIASSSNRTATAQSNISPVSAYDISRFRPVQTNDTETRKNNVTVTDTSKAIPKDAVLQVLDIQRKQAFTAIKNAIKNIPDDDLADIMDYTHQHTSKKYPLPIISVLQKFSDKLPEKLNNIVSNMTSEKYFSEQNLSGFETETLLRFEVNILEVGHYYDQNPTERNTDITKLCDWLFPEKTSRLYNDAMIFFMERPHHAVHILAILNDKNIPAKKLDEKKNNIITRLDIIRTLSDITNTVYDNWTPSQNTQHTVQLTIEKLCDNNKININSFIHYWHQHINDDIVTDCANNKLIPFIMNIQKTDENHDKKLELAHFLKIIKAIAKEIPKIINETHSQISVDDMAEWIEGKGKGKGTTDQSSKKTKKKKPSSSITKKPVETTNSTNILAQITQKKPQEKSQDKSVFVPVIDIEALVEENVEKINATLNVLKAKSSQGICAQNTNSSQDMSSNDVTSQMKKPSSTFSLPKSLSNNNLLIMRPLTRNTVTRLADKILDETKQPALQTMQQLQRAEAEFLKNQEEALNMTPQQHHVITKTTTESLMELQNTVREQQQEIAHLKAENAKQHGKYKALVTTYNLLHEQYLRKLAPHQKND